MQTPEALRIIGEKMRQMGALDVIGMLSQDPPHINYSPEMDRHTAKTKTCPEPVGAPAPGANGACPRRQSVPASFAVRTEAVLLPQDHSRLRTRRSTRPGCEWGLPKTLICARFVRGSHRRGAPTTKTKSFRRTCRSTRPGCEWGLPGALICARFV